MEKVGKDEVGVLHLESDRKNKAQLESIYTEDQFAFFQKGPVKSKDQRESLFEKGKLSCRQ